MSADVHRGTTRLLTLTDGVVAIAITLLILPLTDIPSEGADAWAVLADHHSALFGFALSFVVIANFWMAHHSLTRSVHSYTDTLIWINTVWIAALVFLPFPTSLIEADIQNGFATLYIANLLVVSATTTVLARYLQRHPELRHEKQSADLHTQVVGGWAAVAALGSAGAISVAFPRAGLLALLLVLPMQGLSTALLDRRRLRRTMSDPAVLASQHPPDSGVGPPP